MSTTEIRVQTGNKWRLVLLSIVGMAGLYYYLGYLPVQIWVAGIALLVVILFNLLRRKSSDPIVILNEQGVFDKRLKVGVIPWADIRRVSRYSLSGAEYVCLDLHNMKTYEARRPLWLSLLSDVQRIFGMSSIAISTSGLDMNSETLTHKIREGCDGTIRDDLASDPEYNG